MRLPRSFPVGRCLGRLPGAGLNHRTKRAAVGSRMAFLVSNGRLPFASREQAAFTMVEIALCLAIIGFALVALIGILPAALNVQKENRQETIINNEATVWLDALRSGARHFPVPGFEANLYALTNWTTEYNLPSLSVKTPTAARGLDTTALSAVSPEVAMGLLCTPQTYITTNQVLHSNHVVACIRAFTAPAVNLPPQGNTTVLDSAFAYRLTVSIMEHSNAPIWVSTNFASALSANLRDVKLTFDYPLLPTGKSLRTRTYCTTVGGGLDPYAPYTAPASMGGWAANLWSFRPRTYQWSTPLQ